MRSAIVTALSLLVLAVGLWAHLHEAPHLKYGREINEAAQRGEDTLGNHGHSHSHYHDDDEDLHDHVHSHHDEHHGHSHDAHGHSHDAHGHGHAKDESDCSQQKTKKTSAIKKFELYDKNGYFAFLNDPVVRLRFYSLGATFFISVIPCFMLLFIPVGEDTEKSSLLKILLAFGAGGLLGDAFLHLLPHAQEAQAISSNGHGHTHSHSHSHSDDEGAGHEHDASIGLGVLGGLLFFFVMDKFLRILSNSTGDDSGHGHSHAVPKKPKTKKSDGGHDESEKEDKKALIDEKARVEARRLQIEANNLRSVSWLNLFMDFLHNTTDGLAIGASFITGTGWGIWTMIMVFFHEIPHELSDFALLVRNGWSKKEAMWIQLGTALGAFIGCYIAISDADAQKLLESTESSWVMPFTAGGFIYIATVSVLPDLLKDSSSWLTVGEVISLCAGISVMYVVQLVESMDVNFWLKKFELV